ncbi:MULTISPECIES: hypothetical protein [unclassified Microbacterium]|nr:MULTISPECIES: hypothetical protein [unclassified Microbacterium]
MSDPQNDTNDEPAVEAEGIDPDMPSTDDADEEDDDIDLAELP